MFGVTSKVTDEELKIKKKKLVIKVHPDKNGAPRATDAFKKVNAAWACLSDPSNRKLYDYYGNEADYEKYQAKQGQGWNPEFMSFEDVFNYVVYGSDVPPPEQRKPIKELLPKLLIAYLMPILVVIAI